LHKGFVVGNNYGDDVHDKNVGYFQSGGGFSAQMNNHVYIDDGRGDENNDNGFVPIDENEGFPTTTIISNPFDPANPPHEKEDDEGATNNGVPIVSNLPQHAKRVRFSSSVEGDAGGGNTTTTIPTMMVLKMMTISINYLKSTNET